MTPNRRQTFLRAAASLFAVAAFFHLFRVFVPQAGDPSGTLRHALFVAINLACVYGLWQRPRLFKYPFALLVVQQIYSHGGAAWTAWTERGEVDVVSLVIVVLMPATLAALWLDTPS